MSFGWTAASLVPPHQVSAITGATAPSSPASLATNLTSQISAGTQPQMNDILSRILGPNFQLQTNPSPIAGASVYNSPNFLANGGQVGTPAANGFTQFGNNYWRLPAATATGATPVPGSTTAEGVPQNTSSGSPSAWMPTTSNLFNI